MSRPRGRFQTLRIRFFIGVLVLLAVALVWIQFQPNSLQEARSIPAGYYAKEFCSCRFVIGFDTSFCMDEVREFPSASRITVLEKEKRIEATLFGVMRTAKWMGPREGCRLMEDNEI
jgi:hypothetical protein